MLNYQRVPFFNPFHVWFRMVQSPSCGSQVLWFERLAADLQADLIAGNAVLSAYASRGDAAKAMQWLHNMETQPVKTGAGPWSIEMGHGFRAV
jgi:pentatricopeptide repeat protein